MRILKIDDVMKKTTLSYKDIINNSSAGKFPSPVPLFDDKEGWVESEVDAWIKDAIENRDIDDGRRTIWSYDSYDTD
jgi:prophage regulatory protein|tara:strand:+ start:191 stop:421 length:231 start_codon:yes stop_codon:yes gene_type:complete